MSEKKSLKQLLDDLIECVGNDLLVLGATPDGRPHDPDPEIDRLKKEILRAYEGPRAVWVKASERLPEQTKQPRLYIVKWFDIQLFVRTWTANQLADWVKNTSSLEYFWLDESGTAAGIEWDSIRLIGRVKDRFKELEEKQHDWRSFYCAWLEGRVDMLQQIKGSGRLFELSQQKADLIREANNRDLAGTAAGRKEDACDFAEWMRLNCKSSQNGWVDALGKWDTTKGWYEFKQKEK